MRKFLVVGLLLCCTAADAQLAGPSGRGPTFGAKIEDFGMGLAGISAVTATTACSQNLVLDYTDVCDLVTSFTASPL